MSFHSFFGRITKATVKSLTFGRNWIESSESDKARIEVRVTKPRVQYYSNLVFFIFQPSYGNDTAVLFDPRKNLEKFSQLLSNRFEKFVIKFYVGHWNQASKPSKTEALFVLAPTSSP